MRPRRTPTHLLGQQTAVADAVTIGLVAAELAPTSLAAEPRRVPSPEQPLAAFSRRRPSSTGEPTFGREAAAGSA